MTLPRLLLLVPLVAPCVAADLTGNWVVHEPQAGGVIRRTYFDLKQEGSRITGHIRVTQFYYTIAESTGGPDGFTLTGSMKDGNSDRRVRYEGKLAGDELHIATRRRPDAPLTQMVAHRAPAGGTPRVPAHIDAPLPDLGAPVLAQAI